MPRHSRLSPIRRILSGLGISCALACAFSGCAGGPLGLARYNPVLVEEWKKDEKYGQTLPQRLEEMQGWESQAAGMSPERQQALSQQLDEIIRRDSNKILVVQAVRTQSYFPTEVALDSLRFAVGHGQAEVRAAACRAWGRRGEPEAAEVLARVLGSDTDLDVRITAARELQRFRSPAAIDALGMALDDNNPALQHRCVESLKEVTGKNYGEDVKAWREYVASGQARPAPPPSFAQQWLRMFY